MPSYSRTIFYKIQCNDPEITEIYIGSTGNFKSRKSAHKNTCNNINSDNWNRAVYRFIRLHGGWENWTMSEIEQVNCRNKRHKNQIEAKYIRELGATLNREIPQNIEEGLGEKEWIRQYCEKNKVKLAEQKKEYYEKNKAKILEKIKEYREKNREKLAEKKKEYREKNREKLVEKNKEYYEKNREKLAEKKKVKVKCPCGTKVTRHGLARHLKTKKHREWLRRPEPNLIFIE